MPPEFTCLIFDLDGTLLDSVLDLENTINIILKKEGLPELNSAEARRCIGMGLKSFILNSAEVLKEKISESDEVLWERLQDYLNRWEEVKTEFLKIYQTKMFENTVPFDGVMEVLEILKEDGKRLILYTNKPMEPSLKLVKQNKLEHFFEIVMAPPEYPHKPDTSGLEKYLSKNKIDKKNCLLIGDGIPDLETGITAGIKTCACLYGFVPAEKLKALNPTYQINNIQEILKIILPLNKQ